MKYLLQVVWAITTFSLAYYLSRAHILEMPALEGWDIYPPLSNHEVNNKAKWSVFFAVVIHSYFLNVLQYVVNMKIKRNNEVLDSDF